MIDPGHGGNEPGAVGPTGLIEKDVNFAVAQDVKQLLEAEGAKVVLTRTADYNTTIKTRAEIAVALHPQVFLSIHHNAEPDGPSDVPGNETYYQIANADSKRLAGLLWEEITAAFTPHKIAWAADTDHGAKYRPSSAGGDYYGILRRGAGITTVLSEAAFISNPPEEQLLADPAFLHVEAVALAKGITRFLATPDPGSGFVTPLPEDGAGRRWRRPGGLHRPDAVEARQHGLGLGRLVELRRDPVGEQDRSGADDDLGEPERRRGVERIGDDGGDAEEDEDRADPVRRAPSFGCAEVGEQQGRRS